MTGAAPPKGSVMAALLDSYRSDGDPAEALVALDWFLQHDQPELAAAALDRAYGLNPSDARVVAHRAQVLDQLERDDFGLRWRFIPAGTFLMGSRTGDPDERPVHPVRTEAFWMTDVPMSWDDYCRLMEWERPPAGSPTDEVLESWDRRDRFTWYENNKMRSYYCENAAEEEGDAAEYPRPPEAYRDKPMVAVRPAMVDMLSDKLTSADIVVRLPNEAEWERAARGGLIGKRYPWGDDPPTHERCDFDHFDDFRLLPSRALPPNGYGLFAMSGGVAEWTSDIYDALAYQQRHQGTPILAADEELELVARGGSWADAAGAVTVSHRTAHPHLMISPNVGFRLVLTSER